MSQVQRRTIAARRVRSRRDDGFTLIDMVVAIGIIGIMAAIAIPTMIGSLDRIRLGQGAREVERELQTAKQRAVGKGRPMRIRFNCPETGSYRTVELIGTPTTPTADDTATDRCSLTRFPYPAGDNDPVTRPNLDGPLRRLDTQVRFGVAQTIEFWPDGTAHYDSGAGTPWPMIPTNGISIRVDRDDRSETIRVNGLGKINLETQQ